MTPARKRNPSTRKWGTWRKRALAAEGQVAAIQQLFVDAVGCTSTEYALVKVSTAMTDRPGMNIRLTNLMVPAKL